MMTIVILPSELTVIIQKLLQAASLLEAQARVPPGNGTTPEQQALCIAEATELYALARRLDNDH